MYSLEREFRGKAVIVTGGSKGIGRGCAEVFCDVGASVVICGRNDDDCKRTAMEITERGGGECVYFSCDVGVESEVAALLDFSVKKFGRLDCLVNNAGVYPTEKPIDEITGTDLESTFRNNFFSMVFGCKHALPHLRKTKGSIINVSSVLSVTGMESAFCYTATKGAIDTFTRSLAIDEAKNGVRVNSLRPGNITTTLNVDTIQAEIDDEFSNHLQWMGRPGIPVEMGRAALFLASSMASYVTGTSLSATGGYEIGEGGKHFRRPWNMKEES